MADPNALAGTAYLSVDGKRIALQGQASYRPSGSTRESLIGQDGYHGYKTKPQAGQIKGTFRDKGAVSVQKLGELANVTVTLELVNGKVVIGRNMTRVGEPPEVNTEEGTFDLEFEGPDVAEA